MSKAVAIGGALVIILVLTGTLAWDRFGGEPAVYNGTFLDPPGAQGEFTLISHDNEPISLDEYRGKVVVMYFGYTNCPDFCPGTLSKLARVQERLGEKAQGVQVMMISVDPERDTPERLKVYMGQFDPSFIGVTGPEDTLAAVASSFGIFYQVAEEDETAGGYLVDHTTTVVVLDEEGRQRLFWNWDLTVDQIVGDLENML